MDAYCFTADILLLALFMPSNGFSLVLKALERQSAWAISLIAAKLGRVRFDSSQRTCNGRQCDYFLTRIISICNVNKRSFAYLDDRFDARDTKHFRAFTIWPVCMYTAARCKGKEEKNTSRFICQGNRLPEIWHEDELRIMLANGNTRREKSQRSCMCLSARMRFHRKLDKSNSFSVSSLRLTWNKQRRTAYIALVSHIYADIDLCLRDPCAEIKWSKGSQWCGARQGDGVNKLQSEKKMQSM